MATTHKILNDFCEETFSLLALHSSIEDYSLVYAINTCLKSNLKRSKKDLDMSENISFPIFEWKDEFNDQYWTLITNKSTREENLNRNDLFQDEVSLSFHYLVPEHKDVDFFLKIEQADAEIEDEVLKLILTIPKMITAYSMDTTNLKSKHNLIY